MYIIFNIIILLQDAIQRMEAGNYTGNNVKNRPYRWQGKGPRPAHKQPPPKKTKKMEQMEDHIIMVDGDKSVRGKIRKSKSKTPKIAYSTTLRKVDTRNVSNNVATTSNSVHRVQQPDLSQHSYITTSTQPSITRRYKRKKGNASEKALSGASDEGLVGDSDSDECEDQVSQHTQVFQQIVPQV